MLLLMNTTSKRVRTTVKNSSNERRNSDKDDRGDRRLRMEVADKGTQDASGTFRLDERQINSFDLLEFRPAVACNGDTMKEPTTSTRSAGRSDDRGWHVNEEPMASPNSAECKARPTTSKKVPPDGSMCEDASDRGR